MQTRTKAISIIGLFAMVATGFAFAEELATLRKGAAVDTEVMPDRIPRVVDTDVRQQRNYPMQPPMIPHDTRGYAVNLRVNRCMACHARRRTEESQAPMVSVTHYMDREGNFLAEISPRRYFCNQCHVTQTASRTMVDNTFEDMDKLLQAREAEKGN